MGRTQLQNFRWFLTPTFTFFEVCVWGEAVLYYFNYWLYSYGYCDLPPFASVCLCRGFQGHTHTTGRWWRMGGGLVGMCRLCAGNGHSRSGFSSNLPTLGIPGNPLMNLLLVQTSLCGWGGGVAAGREEKVVLLFCSHRCYGSTSILWICKKTSF